MSLKLKYNWEHYMFKKEGTKEDMIVKALLYSVGIHN
jgi:hypothetical protein